MLMWLNTSNLYDQEANEGVLITWGGGETSTGGRICKSISIQAAKVSNTEGVILSFEVGGLVQWEEFAKIFYKRWECANTQNHPKTPYNVLQKLHLSKAAIYCFKSHQQSS